MEYLTKDEIHRLLTEARKESKRDWLMILLAYRHGLRASEVIELTKKNIEGGKLYIERKKHSQTTTHNLFPSVDDILNEMEIYEYTKNSDNQYLFPNSKGGHLSRFQFYRIMQKYCEKVGIHFKSAHPHVLKHSIAKELIGKIGIEKLQKFLGHKNLNSTAQYLKCTDEEACAAVMETMQ